MRTYKKIHPTKSQKAKAEADYAIGKYENKNAVGSGGYEEYKATFYDLVDNEPIVAEFIDGQRDCRDGIPHQSRSESYDRGYAAQYELEAMNTEGTSMRGRR